MAVHTCFVQNNAGTFARVVLASQFGQTAMTIAPGGFASLFLQDGIKTLSAFEFGTGNVISLFPIIVTGSHVFQVLPGGVTVPTTVSGGAPTATMTATAPAPGMSL